MEAIQLVTKFHYEILEIHTMPRGVVALTIIVNKATTQVYNQYTKDGRWIGTHTYKVPVGAMTIHIGTSEVLPDMANFVPATKSMRKIHKRINSIRDALNHTNLNIFINGELVQPYKLGQRYTSKGIYLGDRIENIKGNDVKYHLFNDSVNGEFKEYFN